MRFFKALKNAENLKASASRAFQDGMYEVAAGLFGQTLNLDPLNGAFNQAIYFNRASAYHKIGRFDEALADCDSAIALNHEYAKAYMKKGDIKMEQEQWENAMHEYNKLKNIAP